MNAGSYIVLQAYGNQDILHECAFALLSLSRENSAGALEELTVCIYTDQPDFFTSFRACPLRIHYREIDPQIIRQWRGSIDFVHRVKIEVLRDFVAHHQGNVLYLDTDVVFCQPVATLFQNISRQRLYMHIMEDLVHQSENVVFQKLSKFLLGTAVNVGGKQIAIPADVKMWNAGVLGFHTDYSYLLDDVLAFTDTVYRAFPKHVVEQFAFSLYFQQQQSLLTAHTYIYHYWNLKELRPVLASFFRHFGKATWTELVQAAGLIQLPDYLQQKANFYYNRSTFDKMRKKKWQPLIPDWNLLMQQL